MIRPLIVPLLIAVVAGDEALAQNASPAPLPGQAGQPPADGSLPPTTVAPPLIGVFPASGAPQASSECADGYASLREDAERKGKLLRLRFANIRQCAAASEGE